MFEGLRCNWWCLFDITTKANRFEHVTKKWRKKWKVGENNWRKLRGKIEKETMQRENRRKKKCKRKKDCSGKILRKTRQKDETNNKNKTILRPALILSELLASCLLGCHFADERHLINCLEYCWWATEDLDIQEWVHFYQSPQHSSSCLYEVKTLLASRDWLLKLTKEEGKSKTQLVLNQNILRTSWIFSRCRRQRKKNENKKATVLIRLMQRSTAILFAKRKW